MCDPTGIALGSAALSGGSAAADFFGAKSTAKAMADYRERQADANAEAAATSFQMETDAVRRRQSQEREQIGEEILSTVRAALGQQGFVAAAQGEGSVAGQSVTDVLGEVARREAAQRSGLARLQSFRDNEAEASIRSARAQAEWRILSGSPPPTITPGLASAVLGAGADAFAAGVQGYKFGQDLFATQAEGSIG